VHHGLPVHARQRRVGPGFEQGGQGARPAVPDRPFQQGHVLVASGGKVAVRRQLPDPRDLAGRHGIGQRPDCRIGKGDAARGIGNARALRRSRESRGAARQQHRAGDHDRGQLPAHGDSSLSVATPGTSDGRR
jgi:hypothetical protein